MKTKLLLILILTQLASSAFALPDCPKDQSKPYDKCFGTQKRDDGAKYVGEFKNDEYHGKGTLSWPDGAKFVGELRMAREMVEALSRSLTVRIMLVNLRIVSSTVKALTLGLMDVNMLVTIKMVKLMVEALSLGLMVRIMLVNIRIVCPTVKAL